ncbi:MAG: malate dehydrogenase [Gammaproteobacteria bacterium]|nr:MAG: malate dehydrogenase [Gammaproteobacteria bacterium]TND03969.1 MAG: malate dehydrogenase [Gammaproteobacteria bacterium]
MKKITIVGAGRVGESTAQILAKEEFCREIMLIDVREGAAQGTALDVQECAPLFHFDTTVQGSDDSAAMRDSDLIIVTAGLPRKPGMSRSDVLDANVAVVNGIVDDALKYAPDAMLLLVTNPVDVLTYHAWKRSGWPRHRVFGQAGVLDAARMAAFVAMETGFSAKDITAMVLGGHGDLMVPMTRYTCVNGIPIANFLGKAAIQRIVERTRQGGAEILALKKNSSAYDAPAAAVAAMVDAIRSDRKRILPCVSILDGEYGEKDVAMGVPVVLGAGGMEKVVDLTLNDEEQAWFRQSVAQIRADISKLA